MRKRHTTKYAGIRYRLQDDDRPDGPRRYIIGYSDANGEYHTETLPSGHTLEDARLRKAELERKKRTHVPTNMTVGELLDDYLETRSASLAPKTYEVYAWGVAVVKDHMGNRKLKSLTTNDCAGLIRSLQSEGKKTWTIKKILTPLVGALKVAVREGWITSNPLDALLSHERPKADQKEMRCLSPDEIPRLLEAASTVRWKTLFATLLFTGMRIGEALELRWEDVYTDHLEVKRSKTKAGEREIMVIPALRELLDKWRKEQWRLANGTGVSKNSRPLNLVTNESSVSPTDDSNQPIPTELQKGPRGEPRMGTSRSRLTVSGSLSTGPSWNGSSEDPCDEENPSTTRTGSETTTSLRTLSSGSGQSDADKERLISLVHTAERPTPSGFVFTNASGAPVGRREALRALNAAEKRAGLPDYTLHELRHTFASMLIAQKETPMLVAAQMGHKDPSVTLKTYTHLFDAQKNVEEARERLDEAMRGVL